MQKIYSSSQFCESCASNQIALQAREAAGSIIMIRSAIFIYSLLLMISASAQKRMVTFATYTYATNDRLANLRPLATYLSKSTGLEVSAISYPSVDALISAIAAGSVDIAMMNTSGYLILQKDHPEAARPVVNLSMGKQQITNYGGCIIARKDAAIKDISQLSTVKKGISFSLVSPSSTSGNLVPRLIMNSHGIPAPDSVFTISYSGTHRQVVEDVIAGKAMIGGCGCAEIDSARARGTFDNTAILIASFNDIPLGPIVVKKDLDQRMRERLTNALLDVHEKDPAVFRNFLQGWTEFKSASRFGRIDDSGYDSFRAMFGKNMQLWEMIK